MAKPVAAPKEPATRGRNATPGPGLGGPGIGDVGDAAKAAAKTGGATPPGQGSPDYEQELNALRAQTLAAKADLLELKAAVREAELQRVIVETERRNDKVMHENAMLQQKLASLTVASDAPSHSGAGAGTSTTVYTRGGTVALGHTYTATPMDRVGKTMYALSGLGMALSSQNIMALERGQWALVPLAATLAAPHGYRASDSIIARDGQMTAVSTGFLGRFGEQAHVFSAVRNMAELAKFFLGPTHAWPLFIARFLAVLESLAATNFGITVKDLSEAWRFIMVNFFTSEQAISDPAMHQRALQTTILEVRNFVATAGPSTPADEPKAEPKNSTRGGGRERRETRDGAGRDGAGAAPQRRDVRERSRERAPSGPPRHQICRDHNGPRGCSRNECRFEHACSTCEQRGHIQGAGQCRGPRK